MTREELQQVVSGAVKELEEHSKVLASAVDALRKTQGQDVNFVVLENCKALLDELPNVNLKTTVGGVRKALVARAVERTKELSK